MRRVGPHSFTEIYFAGCNPSYIETSDGYVMIDSPQQPIDAVRWRERLEESAWRKRHRSATSSTPSRTAITSRATPISRR